MKKIYFAFWIVILLFLGVISNTNTILEKQISVFNEETQDEDHYYISFENTTCTSLNLLDYFNDLDIQIEKIYPKNNLVIDDEKINKELSSFSYSTVDNLVKSYILVLDKYGLDQDIEKIGQYGVIISKVKVVTTKINLNALLEKFPNLQYSYYLNGKYQ